MPLLNNRILRLTGVRPTGHLHIGHYFSVIKPAVELEAKVLIANYHAPQVEEGIVEQMVKTMLDFGVHPHQIVEQTQEFDPELYFQLLDIAKVGELSRMTQYLIGEGNSAHLLVYPVLMVHDVMGYDEICVGEDQMQHVNYARDLITRYNAVYRMNVRLPIARPVGGRVKSLTDPTKKMSKSDPDGCLFLNDSPGEIHRKIKAAVTTEAGVQNLTELYHDLGGTEDIPRLNSEFKPMVEQAVLRTLVNIHEEV